MQLPMTKASSISTARLEWELTLNRAMLTRSPPTTCCLKAKGSAVSRIEARV
jgi:hypothetical protein